MLKVQPTPRDAGKAIGCLIILTTALSFSGCAEPAARRCDSPVPQQEDVNQYDLLRRASVAGGRSVDATTQASQGAGELSVQRQHDNAPGCLDLSSLIELLDAVEAELLVSGLCEGG
ncbi:unnamed protein product, partial [marine sediment metagenome]